MSRFMRHSIFANQKPGIHSHHQFALVDTLCIPDRRNRLGFLKEAFSRGGGDTFNNRNHFWPQEKPPPTGVSSTASQPSPRASVAPTSPNVNEPYLPSPTKMNRIEAHRGPGGPYHGLTPRSWPLPTTLNAPVPWFGRKFRTLTDARLFGFWIVQFWILVLKNLLFLVFFFSRWKLDPFPQAHRQHLSPQPRKKGKWAFINCNEDNIF